MEVKDDAGKASRVDHLWETVMVEDLLKTKNVLKALHLTLFATKHPNTLCISKLSALSPPRPCMKYPGRRGREVDLGRGDSVTRAMRDIGDDTNFWGVT